MAVTSPKNLPIIIVGAGIVGLTLAQSLKQANIPFEIYERDPHFDSNAGGWGITVHWALSALESCLPPSLFQKLQTIQVDPQQGLKDTGKFLFLDIATCQARYSIPPNKRMRINRKKLRSILSDEIDIQWGKSIARFESPTEGEIVVYFEDGTSTKGAMLVGADGSGSRTRRLLVGQEAGKLYQLPFRFMGVTVRMTEDQVKPLRDVDPLLFQGCHPDTGVFMWFSMLSTPQVNGSQGTGDNEYYEGQLNLSWRSRDADDGVPELDKDRVAKMKKLAEGFEPRLKKAIDSIPDSSSVLEIKLQDWPTQKWDNRTGTVTLVGDAAHAMTMYRGEAFNHGITDAAKLSEHIIAAHKNISPLRHAVNSYEEEMQTRTHTAVLLSRQACIDAHDLNNLTPDSPLVSKRAVLKKPIEAIST